MALDTYAKLQVAIADWLERADLTARIPDFISLAEARFNRLLRLRCMETDITLATVTGQRRIDLPVACREAIGLWRERALGREALRFVESGLLPVWASAGLPRLWTLDGGQIAFERPWSEASSLTLRMVGRLALSDAEPSNGLLRDYPDLYLFGALAEAAPYLRDADMLSLALARLEAGIAEARAKEGRASSLSRLGVEPMLAGGDHPCR